MMSGRGANITVLLPVYNDWAALDKLLPELDKALDSAGWHARIVIADDGSTEPFALPSLARGFHTFTGISLLRLRRNLGHQRAISIGLSYIHEKVHADIVVVMDADGQDLPADVPKLIRASLSDSAAPVVFAERMRRSESLLFRVCYHTYRLIHYCLVGVPVRVGNFSAVPREQLARLVVVSELWNHYSAAVCNARIPVRTVPSERGHRYAGDARMSFNALVAHGLSAISVYSATAGVRLLVFTLILVAAGLVVLVAALLAWAAGGSGAAVGLAGIALLALMQLALLAFGLVVFILNGRERLAFLPLRDYTFFVLDARSLHFGERADFDTGAP